MFQREMVKNNLLCALVVIVREYTSPFMAQFVPSVRGNEVP